MLQEKGLDVDGSREMMIGRLEENASDTDENLISDIGVCCCILLYYIDGSFGVLLVKISGKYIDLHICRSI